tara:strand:- start:1136 stop:1477 length:342 start_codon:yes stop_codon:yes gene_type:complete
VSGLHKKWTNGDNYLEKRRTHLYTEMVDWTNWTLEHTWHLLRCTPFWVGRLPDPTGWRRRLDWEIGDRHQTLHNLIPGKIFKTAAGYNVVLQDGLIKIKFKLDPINLVKKLLG